MEGTQGGSASAGTQARTGKGDAATDTPAGRARWRRRTQSPCTERHMSGEGRRKRREHGREHGAGAVRPIQHARRPVREFGLHRLGLRQDSVGEHGQARLFYLNRLGIFWANGLRRGHKVQPAPFCPHSLLTSPMLLVLAVAFLLSLLLLPTVSRASAHLPCCVCAFPILTRVSASSRPHRRRHFSSPDSCTLLS